MGQTCETLASGWVYCVDNAGTQSAYMGQQMAIRCPEPVQTNWDVFGHVMFALIAVGAMTSLMVGITSVVKAAFEGRDKGKQHDREIGVLHGKQSELKETVEELDNDLGELESRVDDLEAPKTVEKVEV